MTEQTELDFTSGEQLKERGMGKVICATPEDYTELFIATVRVLAKHGQDIWFTSDTVTTLIGFPESKNAVGALMNKAAKMGIIEPHGFTKGTRPSQHGHMIRTWVGKK